MSGPPAPPLFNHGDQDHLLPTAFDRGTFDAAPWPKAFLTLRGEGHTDPYLNPDPPTWRDRVSLLTQERAPI